MKIIHKRKWDTKTSTICSRENRKGEKVEQRTNGLNIKHGRLKCNYTNNYIRCK